MEGRLLIVRRVREGGEGLGAPLTTGWSYTWRLPATRSSHAPAVIAALHPSHPRDPEGRGGIGKVSVKCSEPQNPTESEEYQRHPQGGNGGKGGESLTPPNITGLVYGSSSASNDKGAHSTPEGFVGG
eukprot:3213889-Pyramimonas_sp.AAC.1